MARLSAHQRISMTILVAALGYFVDVFDIQLFGILRTTSLKSLGLAGEQITVIGAELLNWQMWGMVLGGILWGVLGDKKGRVQVLFGTILLYSLANIANAFVTTIPAYAAARFFSGLGLAGEVGAGVALASELLPKNTRGYATTFVLSIGIMGPLVASYVADILDWRFAYIIGGVLGLLLLLLRVSVNESGMFAALKKESEIPRGRLRMLLNSRPRFFRYLSCIAIGMPTWFILGVLIIFSPEIAKAVGIEAPVKASTALMGYFIGQTFGSLTSGMLSQFFKNRKKIMAICILGAAAASAAILFVQAMTPSILYALIMVCGFFGTWPLFMTITAEQFGTNLRATAATTAPNFVRASVIVHLFLITSLKPSLGFLPSVQLVAFLCFGLAGFALWRLPETFGRDLDFIEK